MTSASASANDWFAAQQKYWDSWFDQQRKFFNGANANTASFSAFSPPQNQWAELMKGWQAALTGGQQTPTSDTDALRRYFTTAGETYLNMLQQFYQGTGQAKNVDQMTKEWAENLQKLFTGTAQTGTDPFAALDPFNFLAGFPGIGYTREKQEQLNQLYRQWSEYEARAREYNASMAKVGLEAVQKFQEYVSNPPQGAQPLTSLKEVYAKWVDICEEIYAKYAMSDEYTQLYGEVVNALMAFKKQQNEVTDDIVGQLNMPTRAEVDSLHKQMHDLKREIAALKAGAKPATQKPAPQKGKKK
jgi:hypothetical protein